MNRREFLNIAALPIVVYPLASCRGGGEGALRDDPETMVSDDGLRLLAYAVTAPNAHNKQPWLVRLGPGEMELYVDPLRLLPQTDPHHRQIMISQGTFVETARIAASHLHLSMETTLLPDAKNDAATGSCPTAAMKWKTDAAVIEDPLFSFIEIRQTNRRPYDAVPLPESTHQDLIDVIQADGFRLLWIEDEQTRSSVAGWMAEAMRNESFNDDAHGENVSMIRFDEEELREHRDGFAFEHLGLTGLSLLLARLFTARKTAFDRSFRERSSELARKAAFSAPAIGILASPGSSRLDEITSGIVFARIHLAAARLGLALHPMSQILEVPETREALVRRIGIQEVPQMVFRIGWAPSAPFTPRRRLDSFTKV